MLKHLRCFCNFLVRHSRHHAAITTLKLVVYMLFVPSSSAFFSMDKKSVKEKDNALNSPSL